MMTAPGPVQMKDNESTFTISSLDTQNQIYPADGSNSAQAMYIKGDDLQPPGPNPETLIPKRAINQ